MGTTTAGRGTHGHSRTDTDKRELLHEAVTREILGGFFEVYRALGFGFLESVYARSLEVELREGGLAVDTQVPVSVRYRGVDVGAFRADLVVNRAVLVEAKAASALIPAHEHQTLNYLSATRLEVGLLVNFGSRPTFRRILLTNTHKKSL